MPETTTRERATWGGGILALISAAVERWLSAQENAAAVAAQHESYNAVLGALLECTTK